MIKIEEKDILKLVLQSEVASSQECVLTESTGLNLPRIFNESRRFGKQTSISQEYLSNFEINYKMGSILGTAEFMNDISNTLSLYNPQYEEETDKENLVSLPKPRKLNTKLSEALKNRFSSRFFNGTDISLQELSDILFYSNGITGVQKVSFYDVETKKYKRPYPSGGGMYSIKILIAAYHIHNLPNAVYEYQPVSHTLKYYSAPVELDAFIITKRYNYNTTEYEIIENQDPSALIICVNNFKRQRIKYSELSLLLAFVDCGCLLQNISLICTALELNYTIWAGYKKAEAERALKIDGLDKHIIMTSLLGGKIT